VEVAKALGGSFKLVTLAPKNCKGDDSTAQGNTKEWGHKQIKKEWWDCVKNDTGSLYLSQQVAQFRNKWRRRIKGGNQLTQVHREKWS